VNKWVKFHDGNYIPWNSEEIRGREDELDGAIDVPEVGDDIYARTSLSLSHGRDDFIGGLAKVRRVFSGMSAGKQVPFVELEERPGWESNWLFLAGEQERLREQFGENRAHPDPDLRPEFNKW
jgi:hypothetical protein